MHCFGEVESPHTKHFSASRDNLDRCRHDWCFAAVRLAFTHVRVYEVEHLLAKRLVLVGQH